jgi:hypothetical protein
LSSSGIGAQLATNGGRVVGNTQHDAKRSMNGIGKVQSVHRVDPINQKVAQRPEDTDTFVEDCVIIEIKRYPPHHDGYIIVSIMYEGPCVPLRALRLGRKAAVDERSSPEDHGENEWEPRLFRVVHIPESFHSFVDVLFICAQRSCVRSLAEAEVAPGVCCRRGDR